MAESRQHRLTMLTDQYRVTQPTTGVVHVANGKNQRHLGIFKDQENLFKDNVLKQHEG